MLRRANLFRYQPRVFSERLATGLMALFFMINGRIDANPAKDIGRAAG